MTTVLTDLNPSGLLNIIAILRVRNRVLTDQLKEAQAMKHYETIGGQVTRGETLAKLTELLAEAEDCAYVIGHLHATEVGHKDELLATGWRAIGQLLAKVRAQVNELAKGKLQ